MEGLKNWGRQILGLVWSCLQVSCDPEAELELGPVELAPITPQMEEVILNLGLLLLIILRSSGDQSVQEVKSWWRPSTSPSL